MITSWKSNLTVLLALVAVIVILIYYQTLPSGDPSLQPQSETENKHSRPILVPAGLDIVPIVELAGNPWSGDPIEDFTTHNSELGLSRRIVIYEEGSINVDRERYGGIHSVVVRSGGLKPCGETAPLSIAFANLLRALELSSPDTSQIFSLSKAWTQENGLEEIEHSGVAYRAIGGCQKILTIKAI